jgi:hypothetical protein
LKVAGVVAHRWDEDKAIQLRARRRKRAASKATEFRRSQSIRLLVTGFNSDSRVIPFKTDRQVKAKFGKAIETEGSANRFDAAAPDLQNGKEWIFHRRPSDLSASSYDPIVMFYE